MMALNPSVVCGQVTAVRAEPDRSDPDPEPGQERDLLVIRRPADAQLAMTEAAYLRIVVGSTGDHIELQRRVETIGSGPARIAGARFPGLQVRERQAGDGSVAQLQGA